MTPAAADERFPFGRNWAGFLELIDESRIVEAETSLHHMIGREQINGATFVDVGSGSGLFSLAAMRLGARRVHSFDNDRDSVACTKELRRRFFSGAAHWTIEQGSALDEAYLNALGQWDIVYSWGVLHHTGEMWKALDLVGRLAGSAGTVFIAIYNDQGPLSAFWRSVKRLYNRSALGRAVVLGTFVPYYVVRGVLVDLARCKSPRKRYREYSSVRGMSAMVDWRDWLGGYPFEVAKPQEICGFFLERGFSLARSTIRAGGQGCNEFVFRRAAADPRPVN